jgi:hypothetical protein
MRVVDMSVTIFDCEPPLFPKTARGRPCNTGKCVDVGTPTDGLRTCNCSGTNFTGTYCEKAIVNIVVINIVQSASSGMPATTLAGIVIGVVVIGGMVIAAGVKKQRALLNAMRNRKDYHIFISYRVLTDQDLAKKLCLALQTMMINMPGTGEQIKVRCFWDAQDIKDGSEWKLTFMNALAHCCLFVPIISEAAIAPMKNIRPSDTKKDNVLLEYELACGLATKKLLNIFPILVGGGHRGTLEGVSYTSQLMPRQDDGEGNVPMFDFAKYGPHTFPKECSASSRTPITTTINTMLAYQGVILCSAAELTVYAGVAAADKKTSPLESRVFAVRIGVTPRMCSWGRKRVPEGDRELVRKGVVYCAYISNVRGRGFGYRWVRGCNGFCVREHCEY